MVKIKGIKLEKYRIVKSQMIKVIKKEVMKN